jgi:hypothetical protein
MGEVVLSRNKNHFLVVSKKQLKHAVDDKLPTTRISLFNQYS